QLFGQAGHVGAAGVPPLHDQGQQGVGRGALAPDGESEMDADPAAVELFGRITGEMHPRCKLFSFQWYPPCQGQPSWLTARNSSSERPLAAMARAFSTPTYRQRQGSNTMPVAAWRSSGQRRIKP